jgi:hypothetical protein
MSVLTGWHPYRVLCNELLIASFYTEALANEFINARRERWPSNKYRVDFPRTAGA